MRLMTKPWAIACLTLVTLSGVGLAVAQEDSAKPPPAKEVSGGQDVNRIVHRARYRGQRSPRVG